MKGIMYQDYFTLTRKGKLISSILSLIFVCAIGLCFQNEYGLGLVCVLSLPLGYAGIIQILLEQDEKSKFDKTMMSFPITKKEIIKSRYYSSLIYMFIHNCVAFAFALFYSFGLHVVSFEVSMQLWIVGVLVGILMFSLNTPSFYMFGARKGSIIYLISLGICLVLWIVQLFVDIDYNVLVSVDPWWFILIGAGVGVLGLIASYYGTIKVYERKFR